MHMLSVLFVPHISHGGGGHLSALDQVTLGGFIICIMLSLVAMISIMLYEGTTNRHLSTRYVTLACIGPLVPAALFMCVGIVGAFLS